MPKFTKEQMAGWTDEQREYFTALEKTSDESEATVKAAEDAQTEAETKATDEAKRADEAEAKLAAKENPDKDPEPLDKTKLSPAVKAHIEGLEKSNTEATEAAAAATKSADEAKVSVAKMEDDNLDAEIATFMASIPQVAAGQDDLPATLKAMSPEARKVMQKTLEDAETKAKITEEIGKGGEGAPSDALEALQKKADEVKAANPALTKEAAYAQATQDNPDLYDQYRAEKAAAH